MVDSASILNARILVVDDKEDNVRLLESMLGIAGYCRVESATDPFEVCELYRRNRYSLILLDLHMPGMDGFQVMEGLKKIEDGGYLPVIVITARPDLKLRALQAGARDFLTKPFDLAELSARVHNSLEVRLMHMQLEETVRELEASREVIRVKTVAEKKKNEKELILAQQTQESLLPRVLPRFKDFHIHAFNHPTRYVGGDFYDFLKLGAGNWVGILADVSGKGMPAALLSSMVIGALSSELLAGTPPYEAVNRVNRLLCKKSLPFQYVTLFIFHLDSNGSGHFISAGHNRTYLFRAVTGTIEDFVSEAFVLGIFDDAVYESRMIQLDKGDILVVFSDGLTDAQNRKEEMFGEERLLKIIQRQSPSGSHALKQEFLTAIDGFTEGMAQTDDITFLIVEKR